MKKNQIIALNHQFFNNLSINKNAVDKRVANLVSRRSIKKEWQVAWLLRAITCIDLTALGGDDTEGNIKRLCAKAINPVQKSILEQLHLTEKIQVGAVCVYDNNIKIAQKQLKSTSVKVATVSTGFPAAQISAEQRLNELKNAVDQGADEIDIVIHRSYVLQQQWQKLYEEIKEYKKICGNYKLKTIIETGELGDLEKIAKASYICMMGGADFIKTSTGKASTNATFAFGLVMLRTIRDYYQKTGIQVGFKPAGGIRKAHEALQWLILIKEELGHDWLNNQMFRIGTSHLLGDIERQLEHFVTGGYSVEWHHALA